MPDNDFSELLEYLVKTKDLIENKTTPAKLGLSEVPVLYAESSPNATQDYNNDVFIEPKSLISSSVGFDNIKFKKIIRNNQIQKFEPNNRNYTAI